MIEQIPDFPANNLAFRCSGRVTKAEYDSVLVPVVQRAYTRPGNLRLYYETASDFSGIDPGAMWEDFKVGMEHLSRWERIAVVTDVSWISHVMQLFGFLIPGAVKSFPLADAAKARSWMAASG